MVMKEDTQWWLTIQWLTQDMHGQLTIITDIHKGISLLSILLCRCWLIVVYESTLNFVNKT